PPAGEPEEEPRDPQLLAHAGPAETLDRAAQRRPPPAFVDRRHQTGQHQVLRGAGRLHAARQQVEVALAPSVGVARAGGGLGGEQFGEAGARELGRRGGHPRPRGSPEWAASAVRRSICRSPSARAGSSAGSDSISFAIRLRICSEKWGVAGPASARMSSTVTRRVSRSARSLSLILSLV